MNRKAELLARLDSLHVESQAYRRAHQMLDGLLQRPRDEDGSPRNLFFIGESGAGKTRMVRRYMKKYPVTIETLADGTEIDCRPVVYVELPDPFTIMELYQSIVEGLGAPALPGRPNIGDVKRRAFTLLREQKVQVLILDEMDHMRGSHYADSGMRALKHISNLGFLSLVLVGRHDTKKLAQANFQYRRRFPVVEYARFPQCDDDFRTLLKQLERQIAPPCPIGMGEASTQIAEVLHKLSGGLLGVLTPLLQHALAHIIETAGVAGLQDTRALLDAFVRSQHAILGDDGVEVLSHMTAGS